MRSFPADDSRVRRGIANSALRMFGAEGAISRLFCAVSLMCTVSLSAVEVAAQAEEQTEQPLPTPRAELELKLVEEPVTLIAPSPFYHQIPGGIETAVRRAARFSPAHFQSKSQSSARYSIAGRSPLVRGGVPYFRTLGQVAAQSNNAETESRDAADEALARERAIDEYYASVADLEVNGGVWNPTLAEELSALGGLLQQQGEHEEAISVFDRAVHINRINSGLHSTGQLAAVEEKLQSQLALGLWGEADETFDYLYFIQRRAFGPDDPRMIPVLDSIAEWNLRAYYVGYGDSLGLRLSNALMYYSAAARMVRQYFGPQDSRLVNYMRGIASSSYLLSRHPELAADMNRADIRNSQSLMRERLAQPRGAASLGFSSGANALSQILKYELDKRDDAIAIAEAFSNLADWYLLFGRIKDAHEQYLNAWNLLANQPAADTLLEQHFGHIVHMPSFAGEQANALQKFAAMSDTVGDAAKDSKQALRHDYADVVLDVSENGIVRNVRVLSAETADNALQLSRLKRLVRDSTFRPVIKDGVPQRSQNNVLRYRYWY
ncbi:MAG: hypothetical protein P1V29_00900 [Gammaproteobacteria bacterium]|nr:hypothetical protein [Gammaproteobacteria bacterium]